jgi:hypothetical protein
MTDNKNQPQQINIDLDENTAEGIYSNMAMITHSNSEFVVDFIRIMPGTPKAKVKSRIILTPAHAKRFLKALNENIAKYESMHGTIQDNSEGKMYTPYSGPTAQA